MLVWIWCGCALAALALYLRNVYSYFSRRGVKNLPPVPIAGNMTNSLLRKEHFGEIIQRIYNSFPGEKFVGNYEYLSLAVVLRDLDLVKKIGVKEFETFPNHGTAAVVNEEDIMIRSLVFMKGEDWKDMRGTLSPAFTSSKIRLMVPFMEEVGDQMMRSLQDKIRNSESKYIDMDVKDLTSRYTNDVIASCAFGCKVNSHEEENNEFYRRGKEASTFGFLKILVAVVVQKSFPAITKFVKAELIDPKPKIFFCDLLLGSMKDREANNIIRPDMIHLLMQAKKGRLTHDEKTEKDDGAGFASAEESAIGKKEVNREWSDYDLLAQALLFFVAGFDTVSTCMSFLLHELAVNPDVQEKLVREIREYDEKNGGQFDYNSVQKMTYLDMVVSETLRLWPPVLMTDRQANNDFNLGRPNDTAQEDFIVRKGIIVTVPILGIHRDPQYFPDPLRFDPERFSEENKHNIKPYSYMPFGLGPRNCIGSRFALCEVKVMVYQLLRSIEVSPAAKTQIPAKLDPTIFFVKMLGGHWVRFRNRT